MVTVEHLIGNLLLRHNCVIIPGFGGFVAKRLAAKIDYDKGTMQPPSKSILFNRQLLNNDGLLIHEYAKENSVSFDEASSVITELVQQWMKMLQEGRRIEINNVGNLFFDDERNICFEQDRFCNLLLESFGLSAVHFVSEDDVRLVERTVSAEQKSVVEDKPSTEADVKTFEPIPAEPVVEGRIVPLHKNTPKVRSEGQETKHEKRGGRAWRYVAAACILPIAFYSIWIPVRTDVLESGMISFHDLNPFHKHTTGTYEPPVSTEREQLSELEVVTKDRQLDEVPEGVAVYSYKLTDDTYIKVELDETTAPIGDTHGSNLESISHENETFSPNSMHYIVGCFGDKDNAVNLVAKLRSSGMDARIVDVKGGLHRVSAGAAISEEAYQTIKLKADALGYAGWRLR
jgi:nucleoid DNA-binding protein